VTDALQTVLSSYQPLVSQEKKAFLRPLQQLFPGYEEVLTKEKMKKSKSMVRPVQTEECVRSCMHLCKTVTVGVAGGVALPTLGWYVMDTLATPNTFCVSTDLSSETLLVCI